MGWGGNWAFSKPIFFSYFLEIANINRIVISLLRKIFYQIISLQYEHLNVFKAIHGNSKEMRGP